MLAFFVQGFFFSFKEIRFSVFYLSQKCFMLIRRTWKNSETYMESKNICDPMKKDYSQHTEVFLSVFSVL